jgi:hypothetical protein
MVRLEKATEPETRDKGNMRSKQRRDAKRGRDAVTTETVVTAIVSLYHSPGALEHGAPRVASIFGVVTRMDRLRNGVAMDPSLREVEWPADKFSLAAFSIGQPIDCGSGAPTGCGQGAGHLSSLGKSFHGSKRLRWFGNGFVVWLRR